ncbi:hypothetical protein BXQ17_10680 [Polaribacter sp. BM10]|uniref:DMP19 family protein n=1 Tax=Polaribacter sp. BM10 TaxID=1529069 RepID=UPI00098B63AB|nr:DUF4375 domain-containing protein [Polaribacter sp. BM10]AQS94501.1 hypothetical protein BXQ17_10680 [Polaribacter sp. BM10]
MLKRKYLQNEWEEIVRKGSLKYQSLSKDERIWFNLEPIANEGLVDHYMNYGAERNSDLIEDLDYLGLIEISNLFKKTNILFFKNKPPKNIDERNEEMYNWSINSKNILEKNEKNFWKKVGVLEKKLLSHINENILNK